MGRRDRLEPACRLDGDQHRLQRGQPRKQLVQPIGVTCNHKHFPGGMHMHIQPVLRYIDTHERLDDVHLNPSLRKRASPVSRKARPRKEG